MIKKRVIFSFTLFILWMGCSNPPSGDLPEHIKKIDNLIVYSVYTEPSYRIQLHKEQTFGDTEEVFIGQLTDVTIDEAGRVYIADGEQRDIKVYEPDGRFLTRLGRRGEGPGEFNSISNVQATQNGLFAYDRNQQRAIMFSPDTFGFISTVNLAENKNDIPELRDAFPDKYYIRADDTLLGEFKKSRYPENINDWDRVEITSLYYSLDTNGRIIPEKLFEMRSTIRVIVPVGGLSVDRRTGLFAELLTNLSDDSHVYLAWSEDFLIKVYGPDGSYQHGFYYPYVRVPLTSESAVDAGIPEFIRQGMQLMDLPETWPALNSMQIDDENQLWISTIVEDFEVYQWWVLKDTGELLTRFTWPRNKLIEEIKNGYLYARETDEETGVQQIVRYRIEMEEV